jgi:hypothetical protein
MDFSDPSKLPILTGSRLERFYQAVKNAPRDPECGCLKLSETAMNIIRAIFYDQAVIDMENGNGKETEQKTTDKV